MEQKTFHKLLIDFEEDPLKAKQSLSDKRMTLMEKQIISGNLLLRDNRVREALELGLSLPLEAPSYVEAHRQLLLARTYNNLSFYQKAVEHFYNALKIFKRLEVEYFIFFTLKSLCYVNYNLKCDTEMHAILASLKKLPVTKKAFQVWYLSCEFLYFSLTDQHQNAENTIEEMNSLKEFMSEKDCINHLTAVFMYYVKLDRFEDCQKIMTEMKTCRKYHLSANYNYQKKMIDHITRGSAIYLTDEEFSDHPNLYFQLKVIQKLEGAHKEEANEFWHKLMTLYPHTHKENFQYTGDKCLFSVCLEKHLKIAEPEKKIEVSKNANQIEILLELFKSIPRPLTKDELCRYLWGDREMTKDDYVRLSRNVYKLKQLYDLDIQFKQGAYHLQSDIKKVS